MFFYFVFLYYISLMSKKHTFNFRLIWTSWNAARRWNSTEEMSSLEIIVILFASDLQLQHLASAKTWFIDGTFKVVFKPFVQPLFIHFFARSGGDMKQLPGVYILMPRKRKKDYKQV